MEEELVALFMSLTINIGNSSLE